MALRTPNLTGQPATYSAGTPATLSFGASTLEGHQTFAAAAAAGEWADGDTLGLRVDDEAGAVWVGIATWRSAGTLELTTSEMSIGTLADASAVQVLACPTEAALAGLLATVTLTGLGLPDPSAATDGAVLAVQGGVYVLIG